jgi:hypothetical protein
MSKKELLNQLLHTVGNETGVDSQSLLGDFEQQVNYSTRRLIQDLILLGFSPSRASELAPVSAFQAIAFGAVPTALSPNRLFFRRDLTALEPQQQASLLEKRHTQISPFLLLYVLDDCMDDPSADQQADPTTQMLEQARSILTEHFSEDAPDDEPTYANLFFYYDKLKELWSLFNTPQFPFPSSVAELELPEYSEFTKQFRDLELQGVGLLIPFFAEVRKAGVSEKGLTPLLRLLNDTIFNGHFAVLLNTQLQDSKLSRSKETLLPPDFLEIISGPTDRRPSQTLDSALAWTIINNQGVLTALEILRFLEQLDYGYSSRKQQFFFRASPTVKKLIYQAARGRMRKRVSVDGLTQVLQEYPDLASFFRLAAMIVRVADDYGDLLEDQPNQKTGKAAQPNLFLSSYETRCAFLQLSQIEKVISLLEGLDVSTAGRLIGALKQVKNLMLTLNAQNFQQVPNVIELLGTIKNELASLRPSFEAAIDPSTSHILSILNMILDMALLSGKNPDAQIAAALKE